MINRRKQRKYNKDHASKDWGAYGPNSSQVESDLLRLDLSTVMKKSQSTRVCQSKAEIKRKVEEYPNSHYGLWGKTVR